MDNLKHFAHGMFKRAAEAVTPPLASSQFAEKRVLTPEEFVKAGDYLVRACPTWSWEGGDAKKRRPYFPVDKQYLVTRGVPCFTRASELEKYNPDSEFALGGDEEGWVATHHAPTQAGAVAATPSSVPTTSSGAASSAVPSGEGGASEAAPQASPDAPSPSPSPDDDIPDISELELGAANDEAALPPTGSGTGSQAQETSNIMLTRTYDLYITYDHVFL